MSLPSSCFIGDLQKVRWYFSSTALQGFQATAFANGGPLPPNYGVDPTNVYLDVEEPNAGTITTYSYPGTITKEATGVYHYSLDTTPAGGKWWWRAYGIGAYQGSVEDYILVSQNLPGPGE